MPTTRPVYKLRRNGWPRDQTLAQRRVIHPGSREARIAVEAEWREMIDQEVARMTEIPRLPGLRAVQGGSHAP